MIYKTGYTKRVLTTTERREKNFPLSLGTKLGQKKKVERIIEREKNRDKSRENSRDINQKAQKSVGKKTR